MIGEDSDLITIDCEECPLKVKQMSSLVFSDKCKACPCIPKRQFDTVRLMTKYFTKEYSGAGKLRHIEPFFIDVRFFFSHLGFEVIDEYDLPTKAHVRILKNPSEVGYVYEIMIPEIRMTFKELMGMFKEVEEFKETGETNNPVIKRWYLEYGILEHLLFDEKILEININPPAYKTAIRIVHSDYDECVSNIYPSDEFTNYISTRLKISTGRPLNKAQPQIDGEIVIPPQKARVAATIDPFSIFGTAFSIRKHREKPWTLPLFMKRKAFNGIFSGLMSLAIAQGRSFLCAGPRGSGKTALLGSMLLEILPKYRIITIEDTQELPIESYKQLGYDILPLKVRSALLEHGMEISFDLGLRTTLRLGDSCLIVGEIRGKEAKVLYEAMRVGAMSNVVAGTIHGDTPYGVYDRVVNDLEVPSGSFKVTDLIIIQNQIKSPTALTRVRRVLSVTEVLKKWNSDNEPEFQDLLVYDPKKDELVPTEALLNGKSIFVKNILERASGYKDYNSVIQDIRLRSMCKEMLLQMAPSPQQLEAPYNTAANVLYATLAEHLNPLESNNSANRFLEEYKKKLAVILSKK